MSAFDFLSSDIDIDSFLAAQEKYRKLKNSEIDSIPKDEIILAVTCWIEGKFAEDWSDMGRIINGLPTPCLNIYCADYVAKEVLNGGFSQAFFNTSRDFIGAGAEGFRAVGCEGLAAVIESALKINFDSGKKAVGRSIEDFLMFSESGEYSECDRKFIERYNSEKISDRAYEYIMKYKKYFGDE